MGWSSGSILAEKIWDLIEKDCEFKNKAIKYHLAAQIVNAFEDRDCDTCEECTSLYCNALLDTEFLTNYIKNDYCNHIEDIIKLNEVFNVPLDLIVQTYKDINKC